MAIVLLVQAQQLQVYVWIHIWICGFENLGLSKHLHDVYIGHMCTYDLCFGVQALITQSFDDCKKLFGLELVI